LAKQNFVCNFEGKVFFVLFGKKQNVFPKIVFSEKQKNLACKVLRFSIEVFAAHSNTLFMKKLLTMTLLTLGVGFQAFAQDDEFNFDEFSQADDSKIKVYCTNKVTNLSPSKIVALSYDAVMGFDVQKFDAEGNELTNLSKVSFNQSFRLDANVPLISNRKMILGGTFNYWDTRYNFSETSGDVMNLLKENGIRTAALGFLLFKPLNEKHFLIFQGEAALNGMYTYNGTISPEFNHMRYSGAVLFGWKFNDNTNFGFGVVRTYRGGRLLHLPAVLWNKTFNQKWGVEMLLPARAQVRYNFSSKSLANFGFDVEGHSYRIQAQKDTDFAKNNSLAELRHSGIRFRLGWDRALSDFIWFNIQAGVRYNYRLAFDADEKQKTEIQSYKIGLPLYFRVGFSLVSP
jgi:hypothetical protein